jgi:hypothetical protein
MTSFSIATVTTLLRFLFGFVAPQELSAAIVDGADGSCARFASIATVCYREINAGLVMRTVQTIAALAVHWVGSPEHIAATVDLSTAMGRAEIIGREIARIEEEAGL